MKRNAPVLGFVIGLLLPVLGFAIMCLIYFHGETANDVKTRLVEYHQQAASVLSVGLLINILPFIYYTSKRLDNTAKGIFIATMLYVVFIILVKYVW